tara:strand:+ start:366 stop:542 length:177 start_codon:yes stop_codon:yes gene_type:complete
MPNKLPIPTYGSNQITPGNYIIFWENGEMAYSAMKKINELKAKNELMKAEIMLSDWIV